jgi:hypothetical protein
VDGECKKKQSALAITEQNYIINIVKAVHIREEKR